MSTIVDLSESNSFSIFLYQMESRDRRWFGGRIIERVRSDIRDDMALVLLDKPLHPQDYPTHIDRNHLLVATRWQGETLFPISRWNMPVYVCNPTVELIAGTSMIDSNSIQISDWAEICQYIGKHESDIRTG